MMIPTKGFVFFVIFTAVKEADCNAGSDVVEDLVARTGIEPVFQP